jgi:hypothetical protein
MSGVVESWGEEVSEVKRAESVKDTSRLAPLNMIHQRAVGPVLLFFLCPLFLPHQLLYICLSVAPHHFSRSSKETRTMSILCTTFLKRSTSAPEASDVGQTLQGVATQRSVFDLDLSTRARV